MANDCKPRTFPDLCPEPAPSSVPLCEEPGIPMPPPDCCVDDFVERGWYNARIVLQCPEGSEGSIVVVEYGEFFSDVSQEDADAAARAYADSQLVCLWWNDERSANCSEITEGSHAIEAESDGPGFVFYTGSGGWPSIGGGSFVVPEHTIFSTVSREDANHDAEDLAWSSLVCSPTTLLPAFTYWPQDEYGADSLEMYPLGEVTSLYGGFGWVASVRPFVPIDYVRGYDSMESYAIGDILSLPGGVNWNSYGSLVIF